MKLVITGTPGTGKTQVGKEIARKTGWKYINEHSFSLEKGIGVWDALANELEVPLPALQKALTQEMKHCPDLVVEGHLVCEISLPADKVVVLRVHPEVLEARLEQRRYSQVKVQDNVFAEGIDYCKKHALRVYPRKKVIEISARKTIKETADAILTAIGEST